MEPTNKTHKAIQILLHKQYFEKTYTGFPFPVQFIDYNIEREDGELLEYEKKLSSYLVSIKVYDHEFDKIDSTYERISFRDINRIIKHPCFNERYKSSKISEY